MRPSGLPQRVARVLLAAAMITVGSLHFTAPDPFVRIMPSWLPAPLWLVWASGVAEILLGGLLLVPHGRVRQLTRVGLIALLVAVFPANLNMAWNGVQLDPSSPLPTWALWARLPFQGLFVLWAWWVTAPARGTSSPGVAAQDGAGEGAVSPPA